MDKIESLVPESGVGFRIEASDVWNYWLHAPVTTQVGINAQEKAYSDVLAFA